MSSPAAESVSSSLPEPGQLVEVRRRQWVVVDVSSGTLHAAEGDARNSLVRLVSIDENARNEEIQVLWSLEPGARILERAGLPTLTGADDSHRLDAFLDAVRWGAATNADRGFLQSPFRSGVSIESYQLDPLVRAIDMARVNLLIADDVGLGKTIEAGLVVQELLIRHRARTILVVCPSSLQLKWQSEMREKFGLEFRIVDTEYIQKLRRERGINANAWTSYPRLITSMDWMKAGEGLRMIKDVIPLNITYPRKFDVLIVDEAHNVAPAMASRYTIDSQRTSLIRRIAPHFEHRMFLTATPHNGYQESFTSLLELLDDQRFSRNVAPDEKQLNRVMVRRLKTDLVDENGQPIYPPRKIEVLEVDYTTQEKDAHRLLDEYSRLLASRLKGIGQVFGGRFIMTLLKKRLFSSPRAFAVTLAKHRETLTRHRSKSVPTRLDDRILRKAICKLEDDSRDDEELERSTNEAVELASSMEFKLTDDIRTPLDALAAWAEDASNRPDSKAAAILEWLEQNLRPGGVWNDERVILFTEYRATHSWLFEILSAHGFGGDRLMQLHGSLDPEEREKVKAAFQTSPDIAPVRILLATDAASEGIDLQNHCRHLIHVEIPWNPNVMEQRNGRIDRHGQKRSPHIFHPAGKGFRSEVAEAEKPGDLKGDHEYLMRAVLKVEAIREDLGSVGPVIAHQIEEAMLGERERLDTREAEAKAAKIRKFVAAERKLQEKIAKLHDRLLEARNDFHLSPDRIALAVRVGMELADKPPLIPAELKGAPSGSVFEVPVMTGSWEKATAGLNHPHTLKRRSVTFDHDVAKGRDDLVLVHLNHPLVQMCLRILRAEVWALDDKKSLNRIAFRRSKDPSLRNPVAVVTSRLVVTGSNHYRLHEELTMAGGEMKSDGFARIPTLTKLEEVMERSKPFVPDAATITKFRSLYERDQDSIFSAVEARSSDRLESLVKTLEKRKQADILDITSVLDELEKAIVGELKESEKLTQGELGLWPENERMQLRRDLDALKARLARTPQERVMESEAIACRYADPVQRTFPVAVWFIIPTA